VVERSLHMRKAAGPNPAPSTYMKKETKILLFLLFLSPALGELLSSSSPPLEFFNPLLFAALIFLYGCGTLLIREAKVRWNLQWSIIFLAVAYGIVEEGLCAKSIFNPGWIDIGPFSAYGMFLGVQWVWTINLIFFHATLSTLIPIAITDLLWPEYKDVPLLKKRGIAFSSAAIIFITIIGMIFIGTMMDGKMIPYYPDPWLIIGSVVLVIALIWLAYRYKGKALLTNKFKVLSPLAFGIFSFLFAAFIMVLPSFLASGKASAIITIAVQLSLAALALLFIFYQLCNKALTKHHIISLIFGALLFWTLNAFIVSFSNPTMFPVGAAALILLFYWRREMLKISA
jgi:hypothetical protein